MGTMKQVALCMNVNDFYEHGIARGVVRYAREAGDWELYGSGWMFPGIRNIAEWNGDGIISRVESKHDAEKLSSCRMPVVDVAGAILDTGFIQVTNDDYQTGTIAGEHLRECGFTSFAFCGVEDVGWSGKRLEGFADATGTSCKDIFTFQNTLKWWERPTQSKSFSRWVRELPEKCAVFACNDTAGVKLSRACNMINRIIPDDIAIVGVDNEDVLCELASPALSSIPCDCELIGYTAAKQLDCILDGGKARDFWLSIPPRPLVARKSSDIIACDDTIAATAMRFIQEFSADGISALDVIARIPASRRNLEIRFRNAFGMSLGAAILKTKLERTALLLKDSTIPISRIASVSGFNHMHNFYTAFKARFNTTPAEFRKK